MNKVQEIIQLIDDAECILIGIGNEFDPFLEANKEVHLMNFEDDMNYVEQLKKDRAKQERVLLSLKKLNQLISHKNYFIVDLTIHGLIHQVDFQENRIVSPLGDFDFLQCENGCSNDLYQSSYVFGKDTSFEEIMKLYEQQHYRCPNCHEPLSFNHYRKEHYIEERYLEEWKQYQLWVQNTLNKKLLVLELGVGMEYPHIIRFPFEKMTFFNQKAFLYRVHHSLYQVASELKERSFGVAKHSLDFFQENEK